MPPLLRPPVLEPNCSQIAEDNDSIDRTGHPERRIGQVASKWFS